MPRTSIESSSIPDILTIPGGSVGSLLRNDDMLAWIVRVAAEAEHVLSVCNGALVLAERIWPTA